MIKVENDYESVTYKQPFQSKIYKNHLELLLNDHTRPKSNNTPIEQIVNKETTSQQPEKEQTPCSSTNHIYHIHQKNHQKKKFGLSPFS